MTAMTAATAATAVPPTPDRDERGSIAIALLAIIALTTVVGALVATTVGGSRQARFDQQYTEIYQVADAAAQSGAQHLIRAIEPEVLEDAPSGHTIDGTGELDGITYTWQATKNPTGSNSLHWEVVGTAASPAIAGVAPVTREVALDVMDSSRFFLAAFSDRSMVLRGGNAATSYNPDESVTIPANSTGNGIVASNATVRMNGNTTVDGVQLFNFDALPFLDRCDGKPGEDDHQCHDLLNGIAPSGTFGPRLSIGPDQDLDTRFIDEQLAACGTLTDYTASGTATLGTTGTTTTLCYRNFTLANDTTLTIRGTVELYIAGTFSLGNDTTVNCAGCESGAAPDSTKLKVYSAGGGIQIGNHSDIAAGIYAPESVCSGNPSNAQGNIYGSMICGEIANQGGWQFLYDDQLRDEGAQRYQIRAWREE